MGNVSWPGLPQIWRQGAWSGLGLAVGFAVLVNLSLATTLLWSELFTPEVRNALWGGVGIVWLISAILGRIGEHREREREQSGPAGTADTPDRYLEARDHYLKGNWFEAEQVLGDLLHRDPWDTDARLMLATLLRHTGRADEASRQLDRLERLEGSEKWALEICRERERLQEAGRSTGQAGAADLGVTRPCETPALAAGVAEEQRPSGGHVAEIHPDATQRAA